jgi:hypothetical protein
MVDNKCYVDVAQCDCFGPKTIIDKACYELPNISIFEKNPNLISFLSLRKVREYAKRKMSLI